MCARWQILFVGWPPPSGPWVLGQAPGMEEKQNTSEPKLFTRENMCTFMSFTITHKIKTAVKNLRLEKQTDKSQVSVSSAAFSLID